MKITRRDAIGIMGATAAFEPQAAAQRADGVAINWLGGAAPGTEVGVSWGVPWARGTVPARAGNARRGEPEGHCARRWADRNRHWKTAVPHRILSHRLHDD